MIHDTAAANQAHWSKTASTYAHDKRFERGLAQIRSNLQRNAEWMGLSTCKTQDVTIVDYACGPGTAAFALLDYAEEIIGIDSAQGMVEQFNEQVKAKGLSSSKIFAVRGDIVSAQQSTDNLARYHGTADLLVVSMGFHHFDQPASTIGKLVELLKVGGRLVILDFLKHNQFEGLEDAAASTIGRGASAGFSSGEIKAMFEQGGCVDVEVREWQPESAGGEGQLILYKPSGELRFDVFTCRGTKQ